MELRLYALILRRWWWIPVLVVAISLLSSLVLRSPSQAGYEAQVSVSILARSNAVPSANYSVEYYDYLSSEFLLDDVGATIATNAFHQDMLSRLVQRDGRPREGSLSSKTSHRVLTVSINSPRSDDALEIARTVGEALTDPASTYVKQLTSGRADVAVVQPPFISGGGAEQRSYLDLVLRGLLGLIVGVGLAFLLDYLDDTVRGRLDAEQLLELPVIGEVPRHR